MRIQKTPSHLHKLWLIIIFGDDDSDDNEGEEEKESKIVSLDTLMWCWSNSSYQFYRPSDCFVKVKEMRMMGVVDEWRRPNNN